MSLQEELISLANAIGDDIGSLQRVVGLGSTLAVPGAEDLITAVNLVSQSSVFTKEMISGEIGIEPGAYVEIEHGLGAMPKLIMPTLICKVKDSFGYEVGEEVSLDQVYTGISYDMNVGIQSSTTSSKIRIKVATAGAGLTNIFTGQPSIVDPNNYKLIVRAYA